MGRKPYINIQDYPDEEWADIAGYEGLYQVSNGGHVRRLPTTTIEMTADGEVIGEIHRPMYSVTISKSVQGYSCCGLTKNGKTSILKVHRLVAEAFLPYRPDQLDVHHKDRNRTNNAVDNLQWVAWYEHTQYHRHKPRR